METRLAMDLGGTKLRVGEVDERGRVLAQREYPSRGLDQPAALALMRSALAEFVGSVGGAGAAPAAGGVALIGHVDTRHGIWRMIDPAHVHPLPLAARLEAAAGIPFALDNDVKAAARAEMRFGAGRTTGHLVYVNVGTGIGAAAVVDGQLVRGWENDAGEVGHLSADYASPVLCPCGRRGCVEALGSGLGLEHRALASGRTATAAELVEQARAGEALAAALVEDAARAVAGLLDDLARVFNPEKMVLGGGVVADAWFLAQVLKHLVAFTRTSVRQGIVLSELAPRLAGLVGAAAIAFDLVPPQA